MKERIAVVCGGDGKEREVSLRSGAAVCAALREAGLLAEIIDLRSLDEIGKLNGFSKAFIAMHGDWGEGGRLQQRLEEAKIPYTGSGSLSSAIALDKWKARECFMRDGIQVPKGVLLSEERADCSSIRAELGDNIVVKPRCGGSTVGVSIIKGVTQDTLDKAVDLSRQNYNSDVLIEEYIGGKELTAAVWERDGKVKAFPVIEIAPKSGFYDYSNKYTAGATEYLVPAPLEPAVASKVAEAAVKAHIALGCRAYSRSDIKLVDGTPYLLEVNTAPGMTATSLVPKAAQAAGISMAEFVSTLSKAARF